MRRTTTPQSQPHRETSKVARALVASVPNKLVAPAIEFVQVFALSPTRPENQSSFVQSAYTLTNIAYCQPLQGSPSKLRKFS